MKVNYEVFIAKTFLVFLRGHCNVSGTNLYLVRSIKINLAFMDVLGNFQKIIGLGLS